MEKTAIVLIKCVKVEYGDLTVGENIVDTIAKITGLPRGSFWLQVQKGKKTDPTSLTNAVNNVVNQHTRNGDHMRRVLVIQKKE